MHSYAYQVSCSPSSPSPTPKLAICPTGSTSRSAATPRMPTRPGGNRPSRNWFPADGPEGLDAGPDAPAVHYRRRRDRTLPGDHELPRRKQRGEGGHGPDPGGVPEHSDHLQHHPLTRTTATSLHLLSFPARYRYKKKNTRQRFV